MKFSNTAKRTSCSSSSQDQTAIAPHMTFGWLVGRQHRSTEMQLVDPPSTSLIIHMACLGGYFGRLYQRSQCRWVDAHG